jgi:predicted fused transcriptional regulator/phosphomethylpyrimidine kinase
MRDPDDLIYNERTAAERANDSIKDDYGGRHLRVRGHLKVFCHLMFGVAAFTASCLLNLFKPGPDPVPA